jgi:hypothetical protein
MAYPHYGPLGAAVDTRPVAVHVHNALNPQAYANPQQNANPQAYANQHANPQLNAHNEAKQATMARLCSSIFNTVKHVASNPLLSAIVGAGAAILLHNHTPILKGVLPVLQISKPLLKVYSMCMLQNQGC